MIARATILKTTKGQRTIPMCGVQGTACWVTPQYALPGDIDTGNNYLDDLDRFVRPPGSGALPQDGSESTTAISFVNDADTTLGDTVSESPVDIDSATTLVSTAPDNSHDETVIRYDINSGPSDSNSEAANLEEGD